MWLPSQLRKAEAIFPSFLVGYGPVHRIQFSGQYAVVSLAGGVIFLNKINAGWGDIRQPRAVILIISMWHAGCQAWRW
jgi:hypothetical protein